VEPRTPQRLSVYSHADCIQHQPGVGHPEAPFRLQAVLEVIAELELPIIGSIAATEAQILRAHAPELLQRLREHEDTNALVAIDADTRIGPNSYSAAIHAAGSGVQAVHAVLNGDFKRAFCAVRPPGHHATRDAAMGFCLFNSIAIAAYAALDAGLTRITIVDFDVHHGNGTQDIFWNEPRVQYLSSHQSPLYPGTGSALERGLGNIVNAPLASGSDGAALRAAWAQTLLPALSAFAPELILISAGFDAHALDPLAGLNWQDVDYSWITRELVRQAEHSAQGRIVSMLEGGYSEMALRACTRAHLLALADT
jgi:acetoin utilization deacetylase AcuC-like enzyme